eukprot:Pgem_evm1s4114
MYLIKELLSPEQQRLLARHYDPNDHFQCAIQVGVAMYGKRDASMLLNQSMKSCIAISSDGKTAVGLYVDDIYKCGPDTTLIGAINKQYPLKHLGEAQVIIGMEIKQSETHTKIHQQQYIQNVIKQLRIPINTKISTPMATTFVKLIKQSAHNNHHVSKRLLKYFLMYIGIIRYLVIEYAIRKGEYAIRKGEYVGK